MPNYPIFDSHFHIIDPSFPLIANNGYLPPNFTCDDYLAAMRSYPLSVVGGAVVSGSFQGFDQSYLKAALKKLGTGFVGVTQVASTVSDEELIALDQAGVRAIRFNLKRGGSANNILQQGLRVHALVGWHSEFYVDSKDLPELFDVLIQLPMIAIDHLGLSESEYPTLLKLVEHGAKIKATGFGRVELNVLKAVQAIISINPEALIFGTDLPGTRAPRIFELSDVELLLANFPARVVENILCNNALRLYRCEKPV